MLSVECCVWCVLCVVCCVVLWLYLCCVLRVVFVLCVIVSSHPCLLDIEELNELMREAARKINLKGHVVGDKTLYAPGDIEAHLGRDGRFYVVDCARVFPPENPPAALEEMEKGALLFKLLRPEFVQGLMTPLSSDSFSGFQVRVGLDREVFRLCETY